MNPLREKSKSQNVALKLNLSSNAFHGTTPLGINQILSWNKIHINKVKRTTEAQQKTF